MQFLMLPLSFLSVTFMQRDLMPDWMQTAASFNPVNWAVEAGREALSASPDWAAIAGWAGLLAAFLAASLLFAVRGVPRLPALGVGPWVGGERAHPFGSRRDEFDVPPGVAYFNTANLSPLTHRVRRPASAPGAPQPTLDDRRRGLVLDVERLRELFARLIGGDAEGVALVAATSYGLASAARNP